MQKHEAKPPIDHFHFPLQTVSLRRRVTTYNHQLPTAASIIHSAVLWARCAPAASKASAAQVLSLSNLFSPLKWPFFGHIKIVKHAKKKLCWTMMPLLKWVDEGTLYKTQHVLTMKNIVFTCFYHFKTASVTLEVLQFPKWFLKETRGQSKFEGATSSTWFAETSAYGSQPLLAIVYAKLFPT